MARKRKPAGDEAPAVENEDVVTIDNTADVASDLIAVAIDETDEVTSNGEHEAAIDALDAARVPDEAPEAASGTAKRGRGRPAGSRAKPRAASSAVAELPKTKQGLREYAEQLQRERDEARAAAEARKADVDADAINRLAMSLAAGGQMVGEFMAGRRGPHWRLTKSESDTMGAAWATCLAPYADSLSESLPWVVALGVTFTIFKQRVDIDRAAVAEATVTDAAA